VWSVAAIKPNQIHIAIVNLERQGFPSFHPCFEAKRIVRNKLVTVQEPVFPGYLFIHISADQYWVPINNTWGVTRLMVSKTASSEYDEPAVITDDFIKRLMQCSTQNDQHSWQLKPGTRVRIKRGPFVNYDGIITSWSSADRCRLIIWMLNRHINIEVSAVDVFAIELP
jgi:transcriptional antiterminator RfaH